MLYHVIPLIDMDTYGRMYGRESSIGHLCLFEEANAIVKLWD